MNKSHIKGKIKSIKGRINEELGHATGSQSREAKGILQRIGGKLQQDYGDAKDAAKRKTDRMISKY